jgi:hypothetical protein
MAKVTKQHVSLAFSFAAMCVVILVVHILLFGFSIQWTNGLNSALGDLAERSNQACTRNANATEALATNKAEKDQGTNAEIELQRPQGVSEGEVEPGYTGAPATTNGKGGGIYTNTADLRVYSDSACTQTKTSLDLGPISPGGSVAKTIYIKNMCNNNLTLSLRTTNWNPAAANGPITLTWNLEGKILPANEVLPATLTLSVLSNIEGITAFSFDVLISGH